MAEQRGLIVWDYISSLFMTHQENLTEEVEKWNLIRQLSEDEVHIQK